jgi:hypothetical protein
MKFEFNQLGPIYHGELELADLTVLCGKNNTGKTYITNSIYAFLHHWQPLIGWSFPADNLFQLEKEGVTRLDLRQHISNQAERLLQDAAENATARLSSFLATPPDRFQDTRIAVSNPISLSWIGKDLDVDLKSPSGKVFLSIKKPTGETVVEIAWVGNEHAPSASAVEDFIEWQLIKFVLGNDFPEVFIASAERTGAAIFKSELNFNKNKLVSLLADMHMDANKKLTPFDFVKNFQRGYALSVEHNVEFINQIDRLEQKGKSDFIEHNAHLLEQFKRIAGGVYKTTKEGAIFFQPTAAKNLKLGLGESSSAVRSMMMIWFWLNHVASKNSLLMIDEPELNLHPENQRLFARFIVSLVQAGIKVFLTTHSDYIIRELNTLVMLSCEQSHIAQVREKFGYGSDEKINPEQLAVYNTTVSFFEVEGSTRRKKMGTLERWDVAEKHGIKIQSFDEEIRRMNKIQDALLYGV